MGDHSTSFGSLFHSLEGVTISDRKKNFNKLLRDPSFSKNKQQIHDDLDKLEPKTYLESLFKIDALIYFRYTARLFQIIKEGNEVFISKILKQPWFLEEVFQNMDADNLVNNFLPCLSLNMRMKVLKKLSMVLNENKMDEIYTCVHKRYGLWVATKILHSCTKEKLETVFNNEEITFTVNQVFHLFNRNSDLFEMYIDYYKTRFDETYEESKINIQVANKNLALLLKLEKELRLSTRTLGRRTSKKAYTLIKDDISRHFDHYQCLLNKPVLVKKMGSEFKNVYFNRFPRRLHEISRYSECRTLLLYYPKNKRWELLKDTFLATFPNKDLNELFSMLGKNIDNLNMTRDIVLNWAEFNYQKDNDDFFLKYLPPSKAIPMLKEKINVMSDIYKRRNFIVLLLQTCKENNDLTALEEVLKYICFRHRNEDASFKTHLLSTLENLFKLQELNIIHWKYVNELINILEVKKEFPFWRFHKFLKKHLEFLVKNEEDLQPYLVEFMRHNIKDKKSFQLSLKNPELESIILNEMVKVFSEALEGLSVEEIYDCHLTFMKDVIDFSERYQSHYIDLGQYERFNTFFNETMMRYQNEMVSSEDKAYGIIAKILVHKYEFPQCNLTVTYDHNLVVMIIKYCKQSGFYPFGDCITTFIMKTPRNEFENLMLQSYFENLFVRGVTTVNWFLVNDPMPLMQHLNKIFQHVVEGIDYRMIKLYSHLNFDRVAIQTFKEVLESNSVNEYVDIVDVLRVLLPTEDFATLIDTKFAPTKTKLDLEDEDMKKLYDVQCNIAKKIHKVEEPLKMLLVILKFCIGDYLQSALPSLQGVCYKAQEKELYPHINTLSDKAVSVRKHAVFLSCELLKQEYVMDILTTEESNVSSQKHLFTAALKYFRKNPSQELLNLVVKNMSTIDKNDTETLEGLVKITVPKKFKVFYIEKCWTFYESIKSSGVKVENYLENLLENVLSHFNILISLPQSFIENIINNYFCVTLRSNTVIKFVVTCLIRIEHSNYFESVLKQLSTTKKDVRKFVDYICTLDLSRAFLATFEKHWNEHFDLLDAFEEHIMIRLRLIDSATDYYRKDDLAQKIILYLEDLIDKFTFNAFDLFKYIFRKYLSNKRNNGEKYELYYEMLKYKRSSFVCILILFVINHIDDNKNQNYALYQSIMENIKKVEEPIVIIYYKKYIASHVIK